MKIRKIEVSGEWIVLMIVLLAMARLLPHPYNFSPVAAMALFGGAYFKNRIQAFLIPLSAMWLSDFFLNYAYFGKPVLFYPGSALVYLSFVLIVLIGKTLLRNYGLMRLAGSSVAASVLFYIITNAGVWFFSGMYPLSYTGGLACYTAALPFFGTTLAGDLIYTFTVFYGFAFAASHIPAMQKITVKQD